MMSKPFLVVDNTNGPLLLFISNAQYRQLAESVCVLLHIEPSATQLVALLDAKGRNNSDAIVNWCQRQLADIELYAKKPPASLAEKLAERLQAHLQQMQH